ncbi:MAG: hypothetical protein MJZ88_05970 [Paludibacteraceae bacterium]|nr:hypothetical protein [Paludibacteraceae bacterium]
MMKRFVLIFIVFGGLFVSKVHAQLIYQTSDVQKKYYINEGNFGIMPSLATTPTTSEQSMFSVRLQGGSRPIYKITSNHTFYFAADYLNGDVAGTHPRRLIQKAPPRIDGGDGNTPGMPDFTPIEDGLSFMIVMVIIYMVAIAGKKYHAKRQMR